MNVKKTCKIDFKHLIFMILIFIYSSDIYHLHSATQGSLIYLRHIDISTLDPGKSSDHYSAEVIANIFEGLVRFKKESKGLEPCLATKWNMNEEGKRWVFVLRKGVYFHNGEPFNALAVKNSFYLKFKEKKDYYKRFNLLYSYISDIRIINNYKIEFILKKPYAPFLYSLANDSASIIAPTSYVDRKYSPIGTGAFKFSKWIKNRYVVLKKNNNYWEKKVRIEKIIFKVVEDLTRRIDQLKNRKADISILTSSKEYNEIFGNKEFKTIKAPSIRIHYLAFNTQKPPFNKLEARRAVAHMINKKLLIKHILGDFAQNATTPVPPQLTGFNPNIKDYKYDMKKAGELLKKTGIKSGLNISLYYMTGSLETEEIANSLIKNGKKLNLNIHKVKLPFIELREKLNRGKHNMVMMGWVGDLPDPDSFLYPTFTMESGNSNRSFYNNPELTKMLTIAREIIDTETRVKIYKKVQKIIKRDLPWIPLYFLNNLFAYNKEIKGLYVNHLSHLIFKDTYMEKK